MRWSPFQRLAFSGVLGVWTKRHHLPLHPPPTPNQPTHNVVNITARVDNNALSIPKAKVVAQHHVLKDVVMDAPTIVLRIILAILDHALIVVAVATTNRMGQCRIKAVIATLVTVIVARMGIATVEKL